MQPDSYVTLKAYLALEADADVKHEYWDGRVIAMAGAEPEHNQLTANLATEFNVRLRARGYRVAVADQRVRVGKRVRLSRRRRHVPGADLCRSTPQDADEPRTHRRGPFFIYHGARS